MTVVLSDAEPARETVAELLRRSMAEHDAAKPAPKQRRDWPGAIPHLREAMRLRVEAHMLDPAHRDPAWGVEKVPHATMIRWYVETLGDAERAEA